MIGLRTVTDVLNSVIQCYDNSSFTETFTRAFLEVPNLGLSKELNAGSTPTLSAFLSPNSLSYVEFPFKNDEVITVLYTLLSPINNSGLGYTVGDNVVYKTGIFNLFSGTDYIYIDKLYKIDKSESTADSLYLTSTIDSWSPNVYKAYFMSKCITVLSDIPCKLKNMTLSMGHNCCDCEDGKTLSESFRILEAIKVGEDCNDCERQKLLLSQLKKILNLC